MITVQYLILPEGAFVMSMADVVAIPVVRCVLRHSWIGLRMRKLTEKCECKSMYVVQDCKLGESIEVLDVLPLEWEQGVYMD